MTSELKEFVRLFNAEKFFEAHEVLETLWRSDIQSPQAPFFQGLIQLAAALVHVQKQNPVGARRLWAEAGQKLSSYPSPYHGIDTAALLTAARPCVESNAAFPRIKFISET